MSVKYIYNTADILREQYKTWVLENGGWQVENWNFENSEIRENFF